MATIPFPEVHDQSEYNTEPRNESRPQNRADQFLLSHHELGLYGLAYQEVDSLDHVRPPCTPGSSLELGQQLVVAHAIDSKQAYALRNTRRWLGQENIDFSPVLAFDREHRLQTKGCGLPDCFRIARRRRQHGSI